MNNFAKIGAALAAASLLLGCGADGGVSDQAMPFDLEKTKHSFVKTEDGGIQAVVALDPSDAEQVELVRGHLRELSGEFADGNFGDPISVHGEDMDGLKELAAGAEMMEFEYREVAGGAEIVYTAKEGAMVGHLHAWFEAQALEHGAASISEPAGHVMTEEMWRLHHPGQPYPGSEGHG